MKKYLEKNVNLDSEAWTQQLLVIDFLRRDAPVTHTPGTLQEDDLVLKKCIEENSNLGFYSEAWTLSLVQIRDTVNRKDFSVNSLLFNTVIDKF